MVRSYIEFYRINSLSFYGVSAEKVSHTMPLAMTPATVDTPTARAAIVRNRSPEDTEGAAADAATPVTKFAPVCSKYEAQALFTWASVSVPSLAASHLFSMTSFF